MNIENKVIELIDYKTIGEKVSAESVQLGAKYEIIQLVEGTSAILSHFGNTNKALMTSKVNNINVLGDTLEFTTSNTIYTFKLL